MKVEQVLAWWLITIVVVGAFFALDYKLGRELFYNDLTITAIQYDSTSNDWLLVACGEENCIRKWLKDNEFHSLRVGDPYEATLRIGRFTGINYKE